MERVCEAQVAQFASAADFDVDSMIELQHGLEHAITHELIDAMAAETEKQVDIKARKYGVSGVLMGEIGYYTPSLIIESICTNVQRGRILKKKPASPVFIYDFDQDGNLSRVINCDLQLTTYVAHDRLSDVFISVSDVKKEVTSVILRMKDNSGRISRWIQFRWYSRMKIVYDMEAELYQYADEGGRCIALKGISDYYGLFIGLARDEYRFEISPNGKVSALECLL